jgi:hypothetical protein
MTRGVRAESLRAWVRKPFGKAKGPKVFWGRLSVAGQQSLDGGKQPTPPPSASSTHARPLQSHHGPHAGDPLSTIIGTADGSNASRIA